MVAMGLLALITAIANDYSLVAISGSVLFGSGLIVAGLVKIMEYLRIIACEASGRMADRRKP